MQFLAGVICTILAIVLLGMYLECTQPYSSYTPDDFDADEDEESYELNTVDDANSGRSRSRWP